MSRDCKELQGGCGWFIQDQDFCRWGWEEIGNGIFYTVFDEVIHGFRTLEDEITSHGPLNKDERVFAKGHARGRFRMIVDELSYAIQESTAFKFEEIR